MVFFTCTLLFFYFRNTVLSLIFIAVVGLNGRWGGLNLSVPSPLRSLPFLPERCGVREVENGRVHKWPSVPSAAQCTGGVTLVTRVLGHAVFCPSDLTVISIQ